MALMSRYLLPVLAGAVALSAYAEDAGRRIEEIVVHRSLGVSEYGLRDGAVEEIDE